MSRSRQPLTAALILSVLGALALLLGTSPWSGSSEPVRVESDCPGVDKEFEEAGIEPIEFDNGCPEQPNELAAGASEAIQPANDPGMKAVIQAQEEGRIQEGQDPYTYPPDLRKTLGMKG